MNSPASQSPEPTATDLRAVVEGRAEAVDAWFRSEYPGVFRLCFGFLADAVEAEDVAQDAMLHLLDRLNGWSPERSYRAWRNTVVLNLCRDRQRRAGARERAHLRAFEARSEAPLPDPLERLERAEVQAELRTALQALSPREREAFVLRDLDEQSTEEVAQVMGVNAASVRSLLTLARRRLRTLLGARLGLSTEGGPRGQ